MIEFVGWLLIVLGFIATGYTIGRLDGHRTAREKIAELTEQRDSAEELVIQAYVYGETPEIVIPARMVKRIGQDAFKRLGGRS